MRGVVPDEYHTKHMTDDMRLREFPLFFNGRLCRCRMLLKIERSLSPRDISKLREKIDSAILYLTKERPIDEIKTYLQIMNAVHPSQKEGMGK